MFLHFINLKFKAYFLTNFLGEALHRNFDKKFEKIVSNTDLSPELIKAIYKSRYNLEKLESGCDDLQKLSAAGWENYESFEGDLL